MATGIRSVTWKSLAPLFVYFLLLGACGPKPVVWGPTTPQGSDVLDPDSTPEAALQWGERTYREAAHQYARGDYAQALSGYNAYLAQFPQGAHAVSAAIDSGRCLVALEQYEQARRVFERVIADFPSNPAVSDAYIGRITTFWRQGDIARAEEQVAALQVHTLTAEQQVELFQTAAEAFTDAGMLVEAAENTFNAYQPASELERALFDNLFIRLIDRMSVAEMEVLAGLLPDHPPKGDLLHRLAGNLLNSGHGKDAVPWLKMLAVQFPDHPEATWAQAQLEEMADLLAYDRHSIGCLLPISGPYSQYGIQAIKGIELALHRFNTGATQTPVSIVIRDTESHPETTRQAVREMATAGVAAIVGPMISVDDAAVEAQNHAVPIITLTQKENVTTIGDFVFRNFMTPKIQAKLLVDHAMTVLGARRFAILYPQERYGTTFMNLLWDQVVTARGSVVGVESYTADQTDFTEPIKKLVGLYYPRPDTAGKSSDEPEPIIDFDALFIPDGPDKAGLIIPQLAYHDVTDVDLLGTNLWHSQQLIDMSGSFLERVLFPAGFFSATMRPDALEFIEAYQKAYGETPGYIEAVAYDTAAIVLQLLSRTEAASGGDLRDALLNLEDFHGATGVTAFGPDGEAIKSGFLLTVTGGQFNEVPTLP